MKNWITFTLLLLFLSSTVIPLTATKQDQPSKPKLTQQLLDKNSEKQLEIRRKMTSMMRSIKKGEDKSLIFSVLLISFIYGLIHALGPGHGKLLITSIFLTGKANLAKGLSAGVLFAFAHATAGLVLVVVLQLLSKKVFQSSDQFVFLTQRISLYLIIGIGIYLLISAFRKNFHEHSSKSLWITILTIGLVPCPASIIIAMFSFRFEMFTLGIFMVLSMAFGMAVIISLIGIMTILFKKSFLQFFNKNKAIQHIIFRVISIAGSLLLIGFAILFLS